MWFGVIGFSLLMRGFGWFTVMVGSVQTWQTGHSVRVQVGLSSSRVFGSFKFCLGSSSARVKFGSG